ncbi:MAG: extracellular solute-binding protein [Anaerolineales bacterium]|nr:extracellular solute-binding protein [Anaerolineales bacterium]
MDKRLITRLLLLSMILVLLSACGGSQPRAEETPASGFRIITATPRATAIPTATPTPEVAELESGALAGVSLDFWYGIDPTARDVIGELLGQFNAENEAGIQVTGRNFYYPNDLDAAVTAVLGSSQMPDVVLAEPFQYLPWAEAGQVVDLNPYLKSPAYGLAWEDFYSPVFWRDDTRDGRWAFPGLFSAQVMLYNQTWARELGFESPPETPSAFQRQACAAHASNGDQTGGWMIDPAPGGAVAWILTFERYLDQLLDFKSRQVEAAYTFLSDLYTEGCAWYPAEPYPDEDFALRRGLFYAVNTSEIGYVAEAFDQLGSGDEWRVIGYPNPEGEPLVSLAGQSYVVLESDLKTQIAAWLLIRYLTSEESQMHLAEWGDYLPLTMNAAGQMRENEALPKGWRDALALLDQSVVEPPIQQWGILRSVLQDAQAEVLNERFAPGTMSLFLDQLDALADELLQ